mgnify:CR=1 FL=1
MLTYKEKILIDLSSPDGNAFVLLGLANSLAKQLGYPKDQKEKLLSDMKASDYEHLLTVFEENFNEYVELIR